MLKLILPFFLVVLIAIPISFDTGCHTPQATPTITPRYIPLPTITASPNQTDVHNYVINTLCQNNKPFEDFYYSLIEPLNLDINWYYNPYLLPHILAQAKHPSDDCSSGNISLRTQQLSGTDLEAALIAHELAAFFICSEGFSGVNNIETGIWNIASQTLQGMLDTPLRDYELAYYGLDVQSMYEIFYRDTFFALPCDEGNDTLSIHIYAWQYVKSTLYWQDVLGNDGNDTSIYNWYQNCRPSAREEAHDILEIVRGMGYRPASKSAALFQRIIDEYELSCCLEVMK